MDDRTELFVKWKMTERDEGVILREYLKDTLQLSSRFIKRLKATERGILINGEPKTVRYILKENDLLEIQLPEEERSESVLPENIPLHILYEDEHVLVVHKEAGMPSIPSRLHPSNTLANGILYYYDRNEIPYTVHIVTRLDKDTSGLVLVAKHQFCHSILSEQQKMNEIERTYVAIVHGILDKKKGTINWPIARSPNSMIKRVVSEEGKRAITHYKVLQEIDKYSVVEVKLETGRTHQIRVHFAQLGHPLVGDDLYGGKMEKINRQALHCAKITFTHPFTNKEITFEAEVPDDMKSLLKKK